MTANKAPSVKNHSLNKAVINMISPIPTRIYFSGLWWNITNATEQPRNPGRNYWAAKNVWVDSKGLHLKLSKDLKTGKWYCAQIVSEKKFGYGTYQFFVNGRVDRLDQNVVFGLFNYSKVDFHDEMDIEFAKWGKDTTANLHYTIWPAEGKNAPAWTTPKHFKLKGSFSTHRFKRTSNSVQFEALNGHQYGNANLVYTVTFKENIISKKEMPILINLWMFDGLVPSNERAVELIIKEFKFIPLSYKG